MKTLINVLNCIFLIGLALSFVGLIAYCVLEIITLFPILSLDWVTIHDVFWKIFFSCLGITVSSLALSVLLSRTRN